MTPTVLRRARCERGCLARVLRGVPAYVIHPRRIVEGEGLVAILGHTTGSHLRLPDEEERNLTLIWLAHVREGAVERWRLVEDSEDNGRTFRLDEA